MMMMLNKTEGVPLLRRVGPLRASLRSVLRTLRPSRHLTHTVPSLVNQVSHLVFLPKKHQVDHFRVSCLEGREAGAKHGAEGEPRKVATPKGARPK